MSILIEKYVFGQKRRIFDDPFSAIKYVLVTERDHFRQKKLVSYRSELS